MKEEESLHCRRRAISSAEEWHQCGGEQDPPRHSANNQDEEAGIGRRKCSSSGEGQGMGRGGTRAAKELTC